MYKNEYVLNTFEYLKTNKYSYGNSNWCDQLTSFNNDIIIYDEIGNPISIGNNIQLNWIDGRNLNCYIDSNFAINYFYNKDNLRNKKIVNGIVTEYYLEDKKIIFEKCGNNVLYYLYDDSDDLIGFKYNNQIYYYVKNNFNDILGILDSNYNGVTKYTYDS